MYPTYKSWEVLQYLAVMYLTPAAVPYITPASSWQMNLTFDGIRQNCSTKLFDKIVRQNCSTKLFDKIVRQNCSTKLFDKTVRQFCIKRFVIRHPNVIFDFFVSFFRGKYTLRGIFLPNFLKKFRENIMFRNKVSYIRRLKFCINFVMYVTNNRT
jgi:hypothetical protein